jgi:SAM-dependent methyltransferase
MASIGGWLRRFFVRLYNPPWFQPVCFVVESVHLTRAYYVAAELGIADLLQERPRDIAELAQITSTVPAALHRMLRTLASFGVFAENRRGEFRMTRRARVLLSEGRGSLRSWLILMGRSETWQGLARTLESVQTGIPGFELAHGIGFYDYLSKHPELRATFTNAMNGWTEWQCRELAEAYDFGRFGTVMDVGGGMGSLLERVLTTHPNLRGILFDQPETVQLARPRFEAAGLLNRCELVGGSFLTSIPAGADACILKHVVRDWDDEGARKILHHCHQALGPDGTLLIIEAVVDPRNGTDRIVKLVDLEMSSLSRGGFRTRAQLQALIEASGFRLVKIHPTGVPDSQILEMQKMPVEVPKAHFRVPAAVDDKLASPAS